LLLLCGCKSSQKYDLIEAELRSRNRELEATRAELDHYRGLSQAYQSNLSRTADPQSLPGNVPTLPLKEIALGSGTGGVDGDGQPGDEALQIVLVPKDDDGSAVKVPGRVVVLAFEIAPNGTKIPIGRWDVAPEELKKHWRSGMLASGYFLAVQWDKPPTTEKLRIAVRLTTLDGRVYETDRDVSVRPLPGMKATPPEELPAPRPAVRMGGIVPQ